MTTQRTNYLYPSIGMGLILSAIIFVVVLIPRWTFHPAKPKDYRNYTAQELRGQAIYRREGCWYCHSMASRPQDWDHGPRSKASDYYYDKGGHLLGSERSGPDLANIGGKFPDEYHILHHKDPRFVKPGSIMPRFGFLTEQELTDLTAFLQALGPNGTRALDVHTGEMKWAQLTHVYNAELGREEQVARWKHGVEEREQVVAAAYEAHLETPFKYTAEIEELLYGTSHEAQNAKPALQQMVEKAFEGEEALEKARHHDAFVAGWKEIDFKEPSLMPEGLADRQAVEKRRIVANQGRGLYNNQCAACHGLEGNGHGWAAPTMTKRPANFWEDKFVNYKTDTWFWRISRGVPATQMPRWELALKPDQRLYLAAFLKYVAQNKGLGKLKGMPMPDQIPPPSAAAPAPAAGAKAAK